MAGRKKSVSVQEELLLCPSAKPGDWFPGIPVSAVAGIDEAGRGCLAGPVVAAAVILPEGAVIPGLADSKVLSPTRRDGLAAETIAHCDYTVMIPMQHGVDSLNVAAAGAVAFWELRAR